MWGPTTARCTRSASSTSGVNAYSSALRRKPQRPMLRVFMSTSSQRWLASALAVTAALVATPASAQQSGAAQPAGQPKTIQATLAADVGTMADKFTGLARVLAGKYDWKPGPGVRSVGDVLNLIVME